MSNKVNNRAVYIRASIIILGLFLMSYGNKTNHPSINGFIVNDFVAKNKSKLMSKFKNYDFNFNKVKLKGNDISESGLFNPSQIMDGYLGDRTLHGYNTTYTEVSRSLSPREWIMNGGFSADEPELPAGLRHFYDPTQPKGSRYLDDIANSKLIGWAQKQLTNPKTDGVDWALGTSGSFGVLEHIYTWENGKKYMKGALETANPEQRKRYMAKAWRSLGETLHMIADNGCPPHVRNDSHPPGNTSPYEEFLAVKSLSPFKKGSVPSSVRTKLRSAKTARDIAHQMAVFTNENFFSNETISGTDWKGITIAQSAHPNHVYKAPKLQNIDYDDGYYHKNIAGKEVLLCSDKWFFSKFNISKKVPVIDEKCTDSQAKVLIPVIKEAGVNVVKLFIPELRVELSEVNNDGTIKGKVQHIPDKEYTTEIKYNGKVKIKDEFDKELDELDCIDGDFEGTSSKITNNKGGIYAEIEFGGITIRSEQKVQEMNLLPILQQMHGCQLELSATFFTSDGKTQEAAMYFTVDAVTQDHSELKLSWNGSSFSASDKSTSGFYTQTTTVTSSLKGNMSNNGNKLESVTATINHSEKIKIDYPNDKSKPYRTYNEYTKISFSSLPYVPWKISGMPEGIYCYQMSGSIAKEHLSDFKYTESGYNEEDGDFKVSYTGIDYSKPVHLSIYFDNIGR